MNIERFDGGIVNDPLDRGVGVCRMATNFDILTDARRMVPYFSSEDGDSNSAVSQKQNFDIGYWTPTPSWRLFGLGVVSGTGRAEIMMKTLSTGGSADLSDNTWGAPAANASASGSTSFNLFRYYKQTGKFYGAKSGTTIWAFTPDGSTAFDDSARSITYGNIGQGLVHSKDDILYIPYDNKILKNDNGSWTDVALTLPSFLAIQSICEYGNYLAILAAPLSGFGRSRIFLWDRNASLVTLSESIDAGDGAAKILEELGGYLICISVIGSSSSSQKNSVVFRYYTGTGMKKIPKLEITSAFGSPTILNVNKQKYDGRLQFLLNMTIDGVKRNGVWSLGFNELGSFSLQFEHTPINDTAISTQSTALINFININGYIFTAYIDAGSAYALSKTNDQQVYVATAIYESTYQDFGDASLKKTLDGVLATFEPLPAAGQVVLKYRKDAETSWTTIFTESTDNELSHSSIGIDNGAKISDFKRIQFRIESTGGAVITGLQAKASFTSKRQF